MNKILDATRLPALLDAIRAKARLIAPARDGDLLHFRPVAAAAEVVPHADYIVPRNSIKEFFFPRSEPILTYASGESGAQVAEPHVVRIYDYNIGQLRRPNRANSQQGRA